MFGTKLMLCQHEIFLYYNFAVPDENDVYVITEPVRTIEQIEEVYSQMPKVKYRPEPGRWKRLPRASSILEKDGGELRIVMLGDSIVNDTSRSEWNQLRYLVSRSQADQICYKICPFQFGC